MSAPEITSFQLGSTLARFHRPLGLDSPVELSLVPIARLDETIAPRAYLEEPCVANLPSRWQPMAAHAPDSLVHFHVTSDIRPDAFAQGRTLRNSPSVAQFRLLRHELVASCGKRVVHTHLRSVHGLRIEHSLIQEADAIGLRVHTRVCNDSDRPVTLDLLTSCSLAGITPFHAADAPGRLYVHRFRSSWSAEARHECVGLEELQLERSWSGHGVCCERFGQVGSKPTNGWFPFVAIEDRVAGVCWGVQLDAPGSWQMEIYRRGDRIALSGGLADREFGNWRKTLAPGESFAPPHAAVACVDGTLDDLCDALVAQHASRIATPAPERDLPVVFNEWCSSWGNPTHANVTTLADRLEGSGVRYLVIDDGWAERSPDALLQENGDWRVNHIAFPGGLRATCDHIRRRGLIPGLWFEPEVVNPGARAFAETAHQLHLDGQPLQVGSRRFWDFRDPWVHDYLAKRLIGLLRENGFGYLKIDYNDTLGQGCDGPASPGENLRAHLVGVQLFLGRIRLELPDLVIECCSSGGHRLEPSFLALSAMGSFSDAHETPELPLIAANLHRLIPARQNQVWVVLRQKDSLDRLAYSLAAGFLGRPCFSGEIHQLDQRQWQLARDAIDFYTHVSALIADGKIRRQHSTSKSWRHLSGHQLVITSNRSAILVVWHTFAAAPKQIEAPLPSGNWRVVRHFGPTVGRITGDGILLEPSDDWQGGVLLLRQHGD